MKIALRKMLRLAAGEMPPRSSAFMATFGLFVVFFIPATLPIRGDIRIEPQITEAIKPDAKCWPDDPRQHVARLGWDNDPRASVKLTYNKRTSVCLVEIDLRVVREGQIVMRSRSLGDAQGREYANFIWKAEAPQSAGAPAIFCEVFLSSGEQLECHSESEFDEVAASLMH